MALNNELNTSTHNISPKLSKDQQTFIRLSSKVGSLKEEIKNESAKMEQLSDLYRDELLPFRKKIAVARLKLAAAMDKAVAAARFSKKELRDIAEVITTLLSKAFEVVEPCEEQQELYNKWAYQSYNEDAQSRLRRSKEMFVDMMWARYGVEIDIDDIEDTTEGFARFREEIKKEQEKERQQFFEKHQQKSKREVAKEELQKAQNDLKLKNIRAVYISLVKVLHPDNEVEESLKLQKEELMKKVVAAYETKDLQLLLKMEMEWIHNTKDSIEHITDRKLKVYLQVLKEQIRDLENEKLEITHSERYQHLSSYAAMPFSIAKGRILRDKKDLKSYEANLLSMSSACRSAYAKHHILEFVGYFIESKERLNDDDWRNIEI